MYTNPIEKSAEQLVETTSDTVQTYVRYAKRVIDEEFGAGAAAKHPELVAAFISACSMDYATATLSQTLQEGIDGLGGEISVLGQELAAAIRSISNES